ncbi:hypothetical protein HYH03_001534 [Edaphochlamys debaryana]|uniref:Uncharacterized protein n=1 Tax=Edaphochlamys debaryana TaxID=47281 RepID=A0A836C6J5_9CHLO|nr:hypothetical protein HYH03_001534 [Edaphochlamys debaryana]|eukprot:KAG2500772.1 hypothetical protein HYH03_001534 [Edaphochlamys debaryana]
MWIEYMFKKRKYTPSQQGLEELRADIALIAANARTYHQPLRDEALREAAAKAAKAKAASRAAQRQRLEEESPECREAAKDALAKAMSSAA